MQDLQKELLSRYNITVHSYHDVSIDDIPAFLKKVDAITRELPGCVIQLLDCDYVCGMKHLNQGISQAIKAFDENQNFAKDLGLEICVRLSAQKQISRALNILGIKNRGNVLVVYMDTTTSQIEMMEELLSDRDDSLIEVFEVSNIVDKYSLVTDDIVNELNEQIALLALKN